MKRREFFRLHKDVKIIFWKILDANNINANKALLYFIKRCLKRKTLFVKKIYIRPKMLDVRCEELLLEEYISTQLNDNMSAVEKENTITKCKIDFQKQHGIAGRSMDENVYLYLEQNIYDKFLELCNANGVTLSEVLRSYIYSCVYFNKIFYLK